MGYGHEDERRSAMINLGEIKARCEAATPGPWKVSGDINHLVFCESDKRFSGPPLVADCGHLHHADTKEHVREMQKNADFIANAREDLPWALDVIAAQQLEIDRLTEALEIAKRGHVDCMSAERQADGKCLGYGRGENDDEPCAQCSNCPQCTAYEPERKPINEWAALDGICVLDPDGFDRSDPYVLEREITKAEYLAGIWRCTVMPLPAAPEEGESREDD
jgi:hypothetical protein